MIDDNRLLEQLKAIVGNSYAVPFDAEQADVYRSWFEHWVAREQMPVALAMPRRVEEVQAVVRLAAEHDVAVVTTPNATGVGANVGASDKQTVLLDLSRMNRIVEFDSDSAYALLEPGVTFTELLSYINVNDLGFWVDCDRNGANSVCGSICERAFGYTPYGDRLLMQCGMEVVLANGELMRTGMGALPGNNTWQLFKFNYGPYLDGLFSRASNAVVTKVGLWIMPAPPKFYPFQVAMVNDAALSNAIDVLHPYKINMTVPNTVVISHRSADKLLGPHAVVPSSAEWTLYGALYGLENNVELTWQMLERELAAIEGAIVQGGNLSPTDPIQKMRTDLMRGRPAYNEVNPPRTAYFQATSAIEGGAAQAMKTIVDEHFGAVERPPAVEIALTWRTLLLRVEFPIDDETYERYRGAALASVDALIKAGFAISHDSPDLRRAIASRQTGDGLRVVYRHVEAALDPDGMFRTA